MRQSAGREIVAIAAALLGCARAPSDGASRSNAPPLAPEAPPTAAPSAPAPAASATDPAPAAGDASHTDKGNAFATRASPRDAGDLAWLGELARVLASRPVTRDEVIAYLGRDDGPSPNDSRRRRVRPHSAHLAMVEVYPLAHIQIDVALDIEFQASSRPARSAMEQALGALRSMPRSPDDFSSGEKLAHYVNGTYATARVFVELDRKDPSRVAKVHVDADGVKR
jgi:hypothetical protein